MGRFGKGILPLPRYANLRANPVGLRYKGEHLIKGMCPPYYDSMAEAVDSVIKEKFGEGGLYSDQNLFARIYIVRAERGRRARRSPAAGMAG